MELDKSAPSDSEFVLLGYPELGQGKPLALLRAKYIRQQLENTPEIGTENSNRVNPEKVSVQDKVEPKTTSASQPNNKELSLDELDLSELSPELAQLVKGALDESDGVTNSVDTENSSDMSVVEPDKLAENSAKYQGKLPPLNLQTHMYATDSKRRWVKINGQELNEGDWLGSDIQLISITPRNVVIEFDKQPIEIPALYEWKG
ncbi:general secretion pathway protein GspB [Vibrio hannami]|uniref:general secretion pathway protein GspB n=1 Tax=Vibrio hannami TaxID=2717094 RepID=UPI003BB0F6F8